MSKTLSSAEVEALFHSETKRIASKDFCEHFLPVLQSFQHEHNQKAIISYVNKVLSDVTSRELAFKYLNLLMFCCNAEILADNVTWWITLGVGQNKGNASNEMFKFIINVLPLCSNLPDFNKLMVSPHSSYITKVIDMCISVHLNSTQIDKALHCLEVCLQTYPSTCITIKNKVEQFLLKFLNEHANDFVIKRAGRCYHYLQQTGGAGPDGIDRIKNWTATVEQLCSTAHNLYDQFLEDMNEFDQYNRPEAVTINFPAMPSDFDTIQIFSATENRLKNVMGFLRAMLETKYPVMKVIFPKYMFDVVARGLSVHKCIDVETSSITIIRFSILLMKHQIDSLYLLRSYIAALRSNLIPFTTMITKLLLDCLTRTSACTCFSNYSKYKETVYKVLIYWITFIKNNLSTTTHEKLISTILEDIMPMKSGLSLNITSPSKSKGSKTKSSKNKLAMNSTETPAVRAHSQNTLSQKEIICCKALECLANIFQNVHISIKPNTLMTVYSTVIKTILKIQSGAEVLPFRSLPSEMKLYEAVLAIIDTPNNIIPLPLDMAINVFVEGQKHSDYSIVQICSSGLNILEKICQPVCPTLNFPVLEYECEQEARMNRKIDFRETIKETVKIISTDTVIEEIEISSKESIEVEEFYMVTEPADDDDNTNQIVTQSVEIIEEVSIHSVPTNEENKELPKNEQQSKVTDSSISTNGETLIQLPTNEGQPINEDQLKARTNEETLIELPTNEGQPINEEELKATDSTEINGETLIQLPINEGKPINEEQQPKTTDFTGRTNGDALIQAVSDKIPVKQENISVTTVIVTEEVNITVPSQSDSESNAKSKADEEEPKAKKAKLEENTSAKQNGTDQCDGDDMMSSFVDVINDY